MVGCDCRLITAMMVLMTAMILTCIMSGCTGTIREGKTVPPHSGAVDYCKRGGEFCG